MNLSYFISVGENIHCTRSYKVGGKFVKEVEGVNVVEYKSGSATRHLPIPDPFLQSQDWEAGKIRHCAAACWQGMHGDAAAKEAAVDYIQSIARGEQASGATYLDLNVDEFSMDDDERVTLITWLVDIVQAVSDLPMSIDSSNPSILKAGLKACNPSRGKPMMNSVSLERASSIPLAEEFNTVVIASAAGREDLPTDTAGRMANIEELMPMLTSAKLALVDIHLDPLVFPISTNGQNGSLFLEAVSAMRDKYGDEVHFAPGLSNVSFGMPNRKLLGQTFTYLFCEAGGDGGIVDPFHINLEILNGMDTESEAFRISKAVLTGEDDFGMNYIMACRERTI